MNSGGEVGDVESEKPLGLFKMLAKPDTESGNNRGMGNMGGMFSPLGNY